MSDRRELPAYFRMTGEGPEVTLAASEDDGPRKFEMRAYTGAPVDIFLWGRVIFDLEGMRLGRQKKPILLQHNPGQIVGYSTEVALDDEGLRISGRLSGSTESAREVISLGDEGFPWQASIGLQVSQAKYIDAEDEPVEVNGRSFRGGYYVQKSYLRESSFVPIGADDDTSGAVLEAITKDGLMVEVESHEEADMPDPKMDPAAFAATYPEAVDGWREEGRKESNAAEIARAKALHAALSGRAEFALEQFIAGSDVPTAKAALSDIVLAENADLHKQVEDALKAGATDAAAGVGFTASEAEERKVDVSKLAPEDRWEKDAALRSEFITKDDYLAFAKAESDGGIRIFSRGGE